MFVLRNRLLLTRSAILIFITFLQDLRISESFQWIEKEVNQSVEVQGTITLSWHVTFTAQENRQSPKVLLERYPQHNSSAEELIGIVGVTSAGSAVHPFISSPLQPRIVVPQSASVTEPAITISDATKHDEGFYRIEVEVGGRAVANHTIFLTVFVATHNVTTNCGEAVRDKAMTCSCTADGDPVPTSFEWRAPNGTVLHSGSSYTTPRVEQSLNGRYYTCVASNGFSNASYNTSSFNVQVPAKILTITPHSAYVRGSHVELVCSVEGNPPPYVAWINATGSVLQNKTVSSTVNTNYIIQSVSSINIGTYRCETRNKYGNDSKETTITDVFVAPTITNITSPNKPVCEGEQVVLTCEAEGNPQPYLVWKRNGIVLQNSTNTNYTISSVRRGDEGSYTCEATNVVNSTSNITSIADVQFPARISPITPNRSYVVNTSVELTCSAEGDPPPYVVWINVTDGSELLNGTGNASYIIPSVSSFHKGTYRCVAGNRCGNDSKETTITNVFIAASVSSFGGNIEFCEGQPLNLTCDVQGNPLPFVELVNDTDGRVLLSATSSSVTYSISQVDETHIGNYSCVANNTIGPKVSKVFTIDHVIVSSRVAFITPSGAYLRNQKVELNCSVEGDPAPYVAWINVTDGSVLQNRTVNTSYIIPSVSSFHKGTYRCETGNNCAKDSKEMTITDVHYKPTIQSVTGVRDPVCEESQVTLHCDATGNPVPYVAWIDASERVLQNSTNITSYTISQVTRNDEGNYTCKAGNTVGEDISSTNIMDVQYSASVKFYTKNQTSLLGERVELMCSVEGDPPPYVAWINVTDRSVLQNRTVNTSYVIPSVAFHHKGTYRCVTGNRCGSDSQETTITNVFDRPSIRNVTGVPYPGCEGSKATLYCDVTGNPVPFVAWINASGIVLQNSTNITSYTILEVTRNDEGNYTCKASNTVGEDIGSTGILDVQYSAKISSHFESRAYFSGEQVELECPVEGDPPPFVAWINVTGGSVLQNRTFNTSYVIPSVSFHHKGTYRCETGNRCGNDSKEMNITDVFDKPIIENVRGVLYPVCKGSEVTLHCDVTGNPSPYVAWINASGTVLQNSTNVTSYTISNVTRNDEGNYTCSVSNTAGNDVDSTRIHDVLYSARIEVLRTNHSVLEGSRFELTCSVEGDPRPYVAWINVTDGSLLQNRTVNTSYVIPSVSSLHKGTYRCVTGNRCGNDSKETTITDVLDSTLAIRIAINVSGNDIQARRKRRSTEKTTVTLQIENFFKEKFGSEFLWIRIINTSKEAESTKIIFDAVFKPNAKYTEKEVLEVLQTGGPGFFSFSFSLADPCNPNRCPSAQPECTGTPGTAKYACSGKKEPTVTPSPERTKKDNTGAIVGGVVAACVAVAVIITIVVMQVKKKRCHKDCKVGNGDEHKLEERHMSDPAVEAQAGGYSNSGLDHYVNDGPTANKNKNTGKKPEDLYAKVDMSKKYKKKKPGEILYADLADFPQTQASAKSANTGQQPIKNPQSTDYASITDIMQEREGGPFKKVPINTSAADPNPPQRPMDEKPVKDDAGTKETNNTETGDETDNLLARKGDGGVDSKL